MAGLPEPEERHPLAQEDGVVHFEWIPWIVVKSELAGKLRELLLERQDLHHILVHLADVDGSPSIRVRTVNSAARSDAFE